MSENNSTTLRRTPRATKLSLKARESMYVTNLKNAGLVVDSITESSSDHNNYDDDDDESSSNFYFDRTECGTPVKPKLLHENDTVFGDEIYTFQRRIKSKDGGAEQQQVAPLSQVQIPKTPHVIRKEIKKRIKTLESDYEPSSETDDDDDESSSNHSTSEDTSGSDAEADNKSMKLVKNQTLFNQKQHGAVAGHKYTINTDEYFDSNNTKTKTSNNTLEKLETPRLPQYQLEKLLSEHNQLSHHHRNALEKQLINFCKFSFRKWFYILHQDFNILLYGLGSKKQLLDSFHEECVRNHFTVLLVNGFFPTLSIKNILDCILSDLLELSVASTGVGINSNPSETCDLIINELRRISSKDLYLIIHNIDGEMLRSATSQSILARLSSVKKIHLIASIDHINAPLIWDHKKLAQFNYIWWDTTTFQSYRVETAYEKSIMVQQSGTLALSSLKNVFISLTQNSKAIYLTIVKYQIEHFQQYYSGMAFKDLYMKCREAFIVSSDLALRAQLNEFYDHKMVKTKRSIDDGTEYLIIPLAVNLLQKFLEENTAT